MNLPFGGGFFEGGKPKGKTKKKGGDSVGRQEDAQVKIPALIHLTRLGYRYLSRGEAIRDRETNILPRELRAAAEEINGITLSEEVFQALLEELRERLRADDLGRSFLSCLRHSWRGLRLMDFDSPENNRFRVMTEVPCLGENSRFRPDITVFVNGLPLALVEVKSPGEGNSLRTEYDRMLERAGKRELRSFINAAQIMVFSNDEESGGEDLAPTRGAFYATTAYDELSVQPFREEEGEELLRQLAPAKTEEVERILRDAHLDDGTKAEILNAAAAAFCTQGREGENSSETVPPSALSATQRLLTSLLSPPRFVFFLRCGISFQEEEENGRVRLRKQILRGEALTALRLLADRMKRGQRDMTFAVAESGRAAFSAVLARFLAAEDAKGGPRAMFYLVKDARRFPALRRELLRTGMRVQEVDDPADLSGAVRRAASRREGAPEDERGRMTLIRGDAAGDGSPPVFRAAGEAPVFFLDGYAEGYEADGTLSRALRTALPEAVCIHFTAPRNENLLFPAHWDKIK